jgi:hypothetical protein
MGRPWGTSLSVGSGLDCKTRDFHTIEIGYEHYATFLYLSLTLALNMHIEAGIIQALPSNPSFRNEALVLHSNEPTYGKF